MMINEETEVSPSKLGRTGIILGIAGFMGFCGAMWINFVIASNAMHVDLLTSLALNFLGLGSILMNLIGAVLGGMGIARKENKTNGIIAIGLGLLLLFTCLISFIVILFNS
jgi:hypothetical protein